MSDTSSARSMRIAAWLALGLGTTVPIACFFPDYTFNGTGGSTTGTGGHASSSSSSSSGTGGRGGSSSSSSSSSSSGTGGTAGSGGATGGGGSTSSSSSSSSSSGDAGVEDCTNGIDDNGDGKIDCADPSCTALYACTPGVPTGWTGYFALYDGDPAGFLGCPSEYPSQAYVGNGGFTATDAVCTCSCGAPTGQKCDLPATLGVRDSTCGGAFNCGADMPLPASWSGACDSTSHVSSGNKTCGPAANMTCSTATGVDCNQSVLMAATTISGGACSPSLMKSVPPATWVALGEACGGAPTTGKGCNSGFVCMPKTQAPFQSKACIMKDGVNACPAGQFTKQHIYYQNFTDTRGCGACSCGAPSGASCSAAITVYSSLGGCIGQIATFTIDNNNGGCANLASGSNPTVGDRKAVITAPTGGTCAPSTGMPTGAATPDASTATTFCCL